MTKVITQSEIQKHRGKTQAVFAAGTIVTPAAKDWAKEHGLSIVIGSDRQEQIQISDSPAGSKENNRDKILKKVITAVKTNLEKRGTSLQEEVVVQAVINCLEELGYQIRKSGVNKE